MLQLITSGHWRELGETKGRSINWLTRIIVRALLNSLYRRSRLVTHERRYLTIDVKTLCSDESAIGARNLTWITMAVTKVQQNVTHAAEISEVANWRKLSSWFVKVNNWLDAFEIYSCQRLTWNEALHYLKEIRENLQELEDLIRSLYDRVLSYTLYIKLNRSISLTASCASGWDKKTMCILTTNEEFSLLFRKLNMDFVIKTWQNLRKVVVSNIAKL